MSLFSRVRPQIGHWYVCLNRKTATVFTFGENHERVWAVGGSEHDLTRAPHGMLGWMTRWIVMTDQVAAPAPGPQQPARHQMPPHRPAARRLQCPCRNISRLPQCMEAS